MVYRNNAGRLGAGFISVCLETRWLGQKGGIYVLQRYCMYWELIVELSKVVCILVAAEYAPQNPGHWGRMLKTQDMS